MTIQKPQLSHKEIMPQINAIGVFVTLSLIFLFHRAFSVQPLASAAISESASFFAKFQFFLVGFWSDIWIASLFSVLSGLLTWAMPKNQRAGFNRYSIIALGSIWTLLLGFHQAYIEFFKHQFLLFHFQYFFDSQFIQANSSDAFNLRPILTYVLGSVTIYASLKLCKRLAQQAAQSTKKWHLLSLAIGLPLFGLGLHVLNIRYRIQWYVPEQLQVHVMEKIYLQSRAARTPQPFSAAEIDFLIGAIHQELHDKSNAEIARIVVDHFRPDGFLSPVEMALKDRIAHINVDQHEPVYLLVILMESLRACDTLSLSEALDNSPHSITPAFDNLVNDKDSFLFSQAFSAANVTRSAQEAAWCGYPSSAETSLMRGREDVHLSCLPSLAKPKESGNDAPVTFSWLHGGDGRFDGQQNFWTRLGVKNFLTLENFPPTTPRTGWGVGDSAFFEKAAQTVEEISKNDGKGLIFNALLLSVSNHIPWTIPDDASPDVKAQVKKLQSPAFGTVFYADAALGDFISRLKQKNIWKNSLIVISGDHGSLDQAYAKDRFLLERHIDQPEIIAGTRLSHVPILITGGIFADIRIEARKNNDDLELKNLEKTIVSQSGIASFLANIQNLPAKNLMTESLFAPLSVKRRPVYADLPNAIFIPSTAKKISHSEIFSRSQEITSRSDLNAEDKLAVLYFRALRTTLNQK